MTRPALGCSAIDDDDDDDDMYSCVCMYMHACVLVVTPVTAECDTLFMSYCHSREIMHILDFLK
jgi:hypothetical protein